MRALNAIIRTPGNRHKAGDSSPKGRSVSLPRSWARYSPARRAWRYRSTWIAKLRPLGALGRRMKTASWLLWALLALWLSTGTALADVPMCGDFISNHAGSLHVRTNVPVSDTPGTYPASQLTGLLGGPITGSGVCNPGTAGKTAFMIWTRTAGKDYQTGIGPQYMQYDIPGNRSYTIHLPNLWMACAGSDRVGDTTNSAGFQDAEGRPGGYGIALRCMPGPDGNIWKSYQLTTAEMYPTQTG